MQQGCSTKKSNQNLISVCRTYLVAISDKLIYIVETHYKILS